MIELWVPPDRDWEEWLNARADDWEVVIRAE